MLFLRVLEGFFWVAFIAFAILVGVGVLEATYILWSIISPEAGSGFSVFVFLTAIMLGLYHVTRYIRRRRSDDGKRE